ncbi:hypothetical protein JCM33374_g4878 [Metschnikowia sp. JCM 33374]|nr:hypothetical protein JCM33374_g4878 [Metschnikowia sp. JCM 33374]
MFSRGRFTRLPRDRDDALEFVPIGQRVISPDKSRSRAPSHAPVRLTGEKIDNTHIESSFDESTNHFDTLEAVDANGAAGTSNSANPGWNSRGNPSSRSEQHNHMVDGGHSSIQGLQADSQQLRSENYNLKVEVATLKQFLKQTPAETQDLVSQNASLKQQLIKTQDDLDSLRKQSASTPPRVAQQKTELESLKRLTCANTDSTIPQDVLDKVEFLQNENQALLRKLEGVSAVSDQNRGQFETENNDLKLELHRLKARLADVPSDAASQLARLRDTNATLHEEKRAISADLQQAEKEADSLRNTARNLQLLTEQKQAEIDRLDRIADESESSKSRTLKEAEAKLARAEHDINDLKLRLKHTEGDLAQSREEKTSESQRVQRKLDALSKELKEKDRDEYNLRAQVRSLMDERNKAFNNQSTLQHYQNQIDALQAKEKTLVNENSHLKQEMARLQDEVYSQNVDSSRVSKLKQENNDLLNRLDFYEKEYALTQDAMEAMEAELEALKADQKRSETHRHTLETELESVRTKLRRTELSESRKYNESAYMELEDKHRRREEADHRRMTAQVDSLTTQVRDLEKQLDLAKREQDIMPRISPYNPVQESRFKNDLQTKDFELQEKQRDYLKLQNVLKDKEDLIDALEERIRKLNKDLRTDFSTEDRYRENLQKLKLDHDSEVLAIRMERDRLANELKHYKNRLETIMEEDDTHTQSGANSVTIALLEAQLEELRRKNHDLLADIDRLKSSKFETTTREAEEYRTKIRELRFALNDAQQEKSELETAKDSLESDLSLARSEKSRFETKNRTLSQELTKNARNSTRLANKIQELQAQIASLQKNSEDIFRTQKSNLQLQNQVDQLGARLANANLSTQTPPTLEIAKTRLKENELKYLRAKLFELQTQYMDLSLINSFMVSSIRNSSQSCKDDLVKMARCGIYPDYSLLGHNNKKITLKVLATFVLGMVRIKRRTEKAKVREGKLVQLRSEIERDRITLMVEK